MSAGTRSQWVGLHGRRNEDGRPALGIKIQPMGLSHVVCKLRWSSRDLGHAGLQLLGLRKCSLLPFTFARRAAARTAAAGGRRALTTAAASGAARRTPSG